MRDLQVNIDYLTIRLEPMSFSQLASIVSGLEDLTSDTFNWNSQASKTRYGRVFDQGIWSFLGSRLLWDEVVGIDRDLVVPTFVVKGAALSRVLDRVDVLRYFQPYLDNVSRIDLALDGDFTSLRDSLHQAALEDRAGHIKSFSRVVSHCAGRVTDTLYLGSRESALFVRIYDKWVDGNVSQRFELECKRHIAPQVVDQILAGRPLPEIYRDTAAKMEFYVSKKQTHLDRNDPLPEWIAFLEDATCSLQPKLQSPPCLPKAWDWIGRQVAPTLAKLQKFYQLQPGKFSHNLWDLISKATDRLTLHTRQFIQADLLYDHLYEF